MCIGSHAFAMFAHKKFYRCAGCVDDPLPNIVPACIIWLLAPLSTMSFLVFCGSLMHSINTTWCFPDNCSFLLSVLAYLKKRNYSNH